jgi:hypothetical protein
MVGTGLCVAVTKKRGEVIRQDKNKCGLSSGQINDDERYFDWVDNVVRIYETEEERIYTFCKKAPMEPLFEKRNAELKEAATHIVVDRIGQGKRTTKKDVIAMPLILLRLADQRGAKSNILEICLSWA